MIEYVPSAVKLREYDKIFTGSNQTEGYETPFLGFRADTTAQVLKTDQYTYFHYPNVAQITSLSASDLIQAGAIAGPIPYKSDRIFKKAADYKKYIHWGNTSKATPGVWLCAWLSGNASDSNAQPIWQDRWFNPGYIDTNTALFVSASPAVYDINSDMEFEPGVWYKYYHIGDTNNQIFVDSLVGSTSSLKLHIDNWNETTIDLSPFKNTILLNEYTPQMVTYQGVNLNRVQLTDTCLNLDGNNQEAQVLYDTSYNLKNKMTCSFWAYANDWNNVSTQTLIGNNLRGGFGVNFNNGLYTPFLCVISTNGKVVLCNLEGKIYLTKVLPGTSNPVSVQISNDLYIWIADNGIFENYKHLYKMDYNGDIIQTINFDTSVVLKSLVLDLSGNPSILNTSTNKVSTFNKIDCTLLNEDGVVSPATFIDYNLTNTLVASSQRLTFDNAGGTYYVSAGCIIKDASVFTILTDLTARVIDCDHDNNIWALCYPDTLIKFDNTGIPMLSTTIKNTTVNGYGSFNLTNEFDKNTETYKDFLWISQPVDQVLYKYDSVGTYIKKIPLVVYDIESVIFDSTNYNWNRKFNYLSNKINKQPNIQVEITLGNDTDPISGVYTASYPTSSLGTKNWHLFSFTYDNTVGKLLFYIDTVLRNTITTPISAMIYYNYNNPLFIGTNPGKVVHFGEEIKYSQFHFKGKIDDIRIYDTILNNNDFRYLYMSKIDYQDIVWNMATGEQSYLEEIERFFKLKLPGQKQQYYNIKLVGLQISNIDVRNTIENVIRDTVKKIAPAHTELYRIIWS